MDVGCAMPAALDNLPGSWDLRLGFFREVRFANMAADFAIITGEITGEELNMMPDQETAAAKSGARRSTGCMMISLGIAVAWAIATAVHGSTTWPHIPMDISANDPATLAAFESVVRYHLIGHAVVGLVPLLAAIAFVSLVCRKRG